MIYQNTGLEFISLAYNKTRAYLNLLIRIALAMMLAGSKSDMRKDSPKSLHS